MILDWRLYMEEVAQVSVAFIIGAIIGLEREFKSKPAGFRTMILICVGSCLYTILSKEANSTYPDRIASNIVTGIGFIGAGVIFKEGVSVKGLTTAALIWITAALGMAIGYHNYPLAAVVASMVVVALFVLEPVQRYINRLHRVKDFRIKTNTISETFIVELEQFLTTNKMTFKVIKVFKENNDAVYLYRVSSKERSYDKVSQYLLHHKEVQYFES